MKNIVLFGASGTIGTAILDRLKEEYPGASFFLGARDMSKINDDSHIRFQFDLKDGETIKSASELVKSYLDSSGEKIDLLFVASGVLTVHGKDRPEKSVRDLNIEDMQEYFALNTIGPSMIAKYFMPLLNKDKRAVFAILTAKVGSISQNYLGGWYGYRASKAAMNMMVKSLSVEASRKNGQAIVLGLHPGTVDSPLSIPYQSGLPEGQLVSATTAAENLFNVIQGKTEKDTGKFFNWDGQEITP